MRILVITYSYYPFNDPRAFRWRAICEYWAQQGIFVDVVCANTVDKLPEQELVNGVNIYRVRDPSQRFRASSSANPATHSATRTSLLVKIKQWLVSSIKKITLFLRWPDFAWLWIPPMYQTAKRLLVRHDYDGIFSVALPFSAHVVAMLLHRQRNNTPWVCDYGDPFSFLRESPLNNLRLYQRLNRYIERKVIMASQKVSVTTVETAKKYVAHLGVNDRWLYVIPPLVNGTYSQSLSIGAAPLPDPTDNYANKSWGRDIGSQSGVTPNQSIQLVFAGTLYRGIRNPTFLLTLLSEVRKRLFPRQLVMHFYGTLGDCAEVFDAYQSAIDDWIFLHGTVDQSLLREVYQNAHILVNIGNATSYQMPSKIMDYMSTGLPILNMTSLPEDLSLKVLKVYPAAHSILQTSGVTEKVISDLEAFIIQAKRVDRDIVKEILQPNQPSAIANEYLDLLKECPCD